MAESGKIGRLILLPLCFQILIAISIAAKEYPFNMAYAESLKNTEDITKAPRLIFDGINAIDNADQPHTLKLAVAHWKEVAKTITLNVIGENKFYVEPLITGSDIKGRFSLERIILDLRETQADIFLTLRDENNKELSFSARLFTKSDDDGANIEDYAIVQDPITIPQIESLMQTGSAEGKMEWVKALIKRTPSTPWYSDSLYGRLSFTTKPMLTTKQVTSELLNLIREKRQRDTGIYYSTPLEGGFISV